MRVYLAGPITGLTYAGATDWRVGFTKDLRALGHVGVSPMRGKEYLRDVYKDEILSKGTATGYYQGSAAEAEDALQKAYEQFPMSGEQGIYGRDTFDVKHCECTLANLAGAALPSFGTVMELQRAYDHDRYALLVLKDGDLHDHPFVRRAASIIVPDLKTALQVIAAMGAPYV